MISAHIKVLKADLWLILTKLRLEAVFLAMGSVLNPFVQQCQLSFDISCHRD